MVKLDSPQQKQKTQRRKPSKVDEDVINQPIEPKKGRKRKYETAEEAHQARLKQMKAWRERQKNRVFSIITPNDEAKSELKGMLGQCLSTMEMSPELKDCLTANLYPEEATETE